MIRAYAIADASRRPTKELLSGHFETSIPLGHLPQCAPFAVSRSLVLKSVSVVIAVRAPDAQVMRVHCHTSQGSNRAISKTEGLSPQCPLSHCCSSCMGRYHALWQQVD